MSGVTVDPDELRSCADLLYADVTAGSSGANPTDAYSHAVKAVDAVSGKMVPSAAASSPDPGDSYYLPAGMDKGLHSTWVPFTHGKVSSAFYEQLTTAMIARDEAAKQVKMACQQLAEALRDAADKYEAMNEGNTAAFNDLASDLN